ncbi:hypothetical protein HYPSUDRAFT_119214, partial [Hypholoma sublateritium FD-334 SS-4]
GKLAWAKFGNSALRTPDNCEVCIMFNVKGADRTSCSHQRDDHSHMCSFCEKTGHHAFAWNC